MGHIGIAEQRKGHRLEHDHHLCIARGQPFSRAQIKRHPRPAPIINHQLHCDIGFGAAAGINGCLGQIIGQLPRLCLACAITPPHHMGLGLGGSGHAHSRD